MQLTYILALAVVGTGAVSAQGFNFTAIYEEKPALVSAKPVTVKSFDRHASALKIIGSLRSSHSSVLAAKATGKPAKGRPATTLAKATSTKKGGVGLAKPTAVKKSPDTPTAAKDEKAKSRLTKRAPVADKCLAQTYQFSYLPSTNTALGFAVDSTLVSLSAAGMAPAGYTKVFTGLLGSIFADSEYLTYHEMASYNASQCAAYCDAFPGCASFNLYFERLPSVQPSSSCSNPAASVAIKCALWKNKPTTADAKNKGEFRQDFVVLITGSNLYYKNAAPATINGYTGPTPLPAVVDVYDSTLSSLLVGSNFFQGTYNPAACTSWCAGVATASKPCEYIVAAIISIRNSGPLGTYCLGYTSSSVERYATVYNATINGVTYDATYSYAYNLAHKG